MDTPLSNSQARELVLGGTSVETAEHLMRPDLTDCPNCHEEDVAPEAIFECDTEGCDQKGCPECWDKCPDCSGVHCEEHAKECEYCGRWICLNCYYANGHLVQCLMRKVERDCNI